MDYLYSLYAALVSINVPNDKARAVVDAMERDMGTTLATKADLAEVRQECAVIGKDIEILSGKMAALSKDITVRLGSTMLALVMLLFTALRSLLETCEFTFEDEPAIEEALCNWQDSGFGFTDCLIAAHNRRLGCRATATFDAKAARPPGFFAA